MRLRQIATTTATATTGVADLVPPDIKNKFFEIFDYIDEHYRENIQAEQVMFMAGLGHTAFSEYLKLLTGKNFKEYLTHLRIGKSKKTPCHNPKISNRNRT